MKTRSSAATCLFIAVTLVATLPTSWKLAQSPDIALPQGRHPARVIEPKVPDSVARGAAEPATRPGEEALQDLADFEEDMDHVFATLPGSHLGRLKHIVSTQAAERASYVLEHLASASRLAPASKGDIIEAAMRHPSQEIRMQALEAIDSSLAPHIEPVLQAALTDATPAVQLQALGALESMPPAQRMRWYQKGAASPFEEVQLALVTLLSNEENPQAHALLLNFIQAESAWVRHAAEFESRYLLDAESMVQDVVTRIAARNGGAQTARQQ